ncbi:uncharacterized protein LOC135194149 [Vanessa tameamea]|uniref:Uncharacterized protein LOC135194149 n=1 Tax=Vanessa tameamea TaxID=334116 RepID=A0ABM4AUX3_VANTA
MKFKCIMTRDKIYTYLLIIYFELRRGYCFTNYQLFQGFDVGIYDSTATTDTTTTNRQNVTEIKSSPILSTSSLSLTTSTSAPTTLKYLHTTKSDNKKKHISNKTCFEEQPSNIGSYEVPTQRDIILFTKDLILNLFETYKRDAMSLLRDIKEVTKGTTSIEKNCKYNKTAYKQCVKLVSVQSEIITKSLVTSLEMKTVDIEDLTENTICNLSEMKKDPIPLIKLLAQETTMLKFALPGFLRLLNTCSTHCDKSQRTVNTKKPLRRMTDQDLVVKYFLTKKE